MVGEASNSYKRIGFVEPLLNTGIEQWSYCEGVYDSFRKSYVPNQWKPYLGTLEDAVMANVAPVVTDMQDLGIKFLHVVDNNVHYSMSTMQGVVDHSKQLVSSTLAATKSVHEKNIPVYYNSMKSYFDAVVKKGDWIADKLSPSKTVQAANETLKTAVSKAYDMTDPDKAVETVQQAWTNFSRVPSVAALLRTAEPITEKGASFAASTHDWLVKSPYYQRAYNTGAATLSWSLSTFPARLAKAWVYPAVAPVADPLVERFSKSSSVKSLLDYWKPAM